MICWVFFGGATILTTAHLTCTCFVQVQLQAQVGFIVACQACGTVSFTNVLIVVCGRPLSPAFALFDASFSRSTSLPRPRTNNLDVANPATPLM